MLSGSDGHLRELVRGTRLLLEGIGGAEALRDELGYYEPRLLRPNFPTIGHIHIRLCDSIRNTGRMRLVITDRYFEAIANQLLIRSVDSVCNGGVQLVTEIVRTSCQLSEDVQNEKRSWRIFKRGVVDGACYLTKFREPKEFYSYIDSHVDTVDRAWELALELDPIAGVGPPLACDFLKEIGVDRFGKPDVHIKDTFHKLRLIGEVNQDRQAFEVLWHMACLIGSSAAVVDKVLWIAASGRWDRTLDKELDQQRRKAEQLQRRQRFGYLLDELVRDA